MSRATFTGLCVFCLLCVGCDAQSTSTTKQSEALRFGTPLDQQRLEIYQRSCNACHRNDVPGIPRAGDPADWEQRKAQGLDVLVQHAMNGYRGMPPMGLCPTCTKKDMRALVAYMAGIQLEPDAQ